MILNTVNKSLEIVLGGAVATNQAVFSVVFMDIDQSNFKTVAWDSVDGVSNNTTAVEMVGSPASGVSRLIEEVNIHNPDTAAADVKVQINNNATLRTQVDESLSAGRTLQYTRQKGWRIVNDAGVIESVLGDATTTDPFADDTNLLGISNTGGFVKNTWAKLKSFFATISGGNTFSGLQIIRLTTEVGKYLSMSGSGNSADLRDLEISSESTDAVGDAHIFNASGSTGKIILRINGTEFFRITSEGASLDGGSNILNHDPGVDWTPIDTSGAGHPLTVNSSRTSSIRIGNLVVLNAQIEYPSTSNTAQVSIGGLPYSVASDQSVTAGGFFTKFDNGASVLRFIGNNIEFREMDVSAINNSQISGQTVRFTAFYQTS